MLNVRYHHKEGQVRIGQCEENQEGTKGSSLSLHHLALQVDSERPEQQYQCED